jgi:hypothetical protein
MNICRVRAELYHADGGKDGQTDMTKLIAFSSFATTPQNFAMKTPTRYILITT